jgi:hypothetical protein
MKSQIHNGNPDDYRDGFGSLNLLDFNTGMVFDIASNGEKLWIIYERLLIPGIISEKQALTEVIPLARTTHPDELLNCAIVFDQDAGRARYYVDLEMVFESPQIPVDVEILQGGFGFIILHKIEGGKSTSCRGQGGQGLWGDFSVYSY